MLDRLSSIFTKQKSPLVTAKAAQSWWKQLNEADAGTQLQKVHDVVVNFQETGVPHSVDTLQALLWIDDAVQAAFEAICFQYVSNPRMPKEMEQKLWRDICGFSQCMIDAYAQYVQAGGQDSGSGNNLYEQQMPQVLARSLRYISTQAKWHYFRFEKAPAKLWTTAHQYYRLAEIEDFDSNPFPLYPSISDEVTSCADEYIQLLMLATISSNNLSVTQISWVDRWLEQWSKLVQISRKYLDGRHHYCVCLKDASGPQKIGPEAEGETYRYWGVGELVTRVQEALSRLEGGAKPASIGLGENCPSAGASELLKHLDVFWTMSMRNCLFQRTERQKVRKAASVIHGLDKLCGHVKEDNNRFRKNTDATDDTGRVDYDEVMDMRLYGFVSNRTKTKLAQSPYSIQAKQHDWQTWEIDNESVSGLGAVLNYNTSDWVRPGVLVGVRVNDKDNWQVGVLRRLNRLNEGEVYAGVQILTATPVTVVMHSDELDRIESITVQEIGFTGGIDLPNVRTAIYLPHKIEGVNINTLIMRAADYSHGRVYRVQARDKMFSVSLSNVLEKGVDWIWVAVNVLSQEH